MNNIKTGFIIIFNLLFNIREKNNNYNYYNPFAF